MNLRCCKLLIVLVFTSHFAHAQDFGLSFSYFIPRNGSFSTPISPFSIRGIGINLTRNIALQTGASLYRMSGLNMKDLPLESNKPLVGPNFTLLIPGELVLQFGNDVAQLNLKGGGFVFYGVANNLNYGNIDRAIREYEDWEVANAELEYENHPGAGYMFGVEFIVYVTNQIGLSFETNYLAGDAKFPLTGNYIGGSSALTTKQVDYPDARVDLTGLEFSIGIFYSTGQNTRRRSHR